MVVSGQLWPFQAPCGWLQPLSGKVLLLCSCLWDQFWMFSYFQSTSQLLHVLATGSSQLVCNNPSYSWTPTYPTYNEGYNPLINWGEPPHSCCDLRVCPNSRSRLSWKCGSFLVVYQNPGVSPTKKGYSYQQNNTWGHCSQFWDPSLRYGVKLGHFQNWMPLYQPSPWYPMVNTEIAGIYGCSSFIPQMEF